MLRLWFTTRFLYALGAIALLLACSAGLPELGPIAVAGAAALGVATLADLVWCPRAGMLHVSRDCSDHFALRRKETIRYAVDNCTARPVRVGIVESPVRTLEFLTDEAIGTVLPFARTIVERNAMPAARGSDAFGTLYVWAESRLGLLRRRMRIAQARAFRVFPDLSAVERYGNLRVRNRSLDAGLRRMRLRGAGTEFESLREWASDDAFSAIDWKATARRGKLMVVQHEVERSQNVMLLLDCGRLMTARVGEQRKLDYAVTAALSVATVAGSSSDRVGVVAFARDILAATAPRAAKASAASLCALLYDLEPRFEEANYSRAFSYVGKHLHKRSLVVFLTDVIDPLSQGALLAELAVMARRHLVVCAFMNDAAVASALSEEPRDVLGAYRAGVALELREERATAAKIVERTGAIVIDVPAPSLTTALIDEYLRVKRRGLL